MMPSWWPLNWWPFCPHKVSQMIREVHGDERVYACSWWRCYNCGVERASQNPDARVSPFVVRA